MNRNVVVLSRVAAQIGSCSVVVLSCGIRTLVGGQSQHVLRVQSHGVGSKVRGGCLVLGAVDQQLSRRPWCGGSERKEAEKCQRAIPRYRTHTYISSCLIKGKSKLNAASVMLFLSQCLSYLIDVSVSSSVRLKLYLNIKIVKIFFV